MAKKSTIVKAPERYTLQGALKELQKEYGDRVTIWTLRRAIGAGKLPHERNVGGLRRGRIFIAAKDLAAFKPVEKVGG